MQQCSFLNDSSRFPKLVYGSMALIAFLVQSKLLVLVISVLMFLSAFSLSYNIPYLIYVFMEKSLLKKKVAPMQKEPGELRFSYVMAGILIFIGFLLLQFTKYATFAWLYILIVAFMMFLACFVGFCMGVLMYVAFKNFLLKMKTIRNKHA